MQENFQDEISLKELLMTLWKGKRIIAGVTLLAILLSMMGTLWLQNQSNSVSIVVAFKHEGIESHLNPDGTKFDPYQMATPYVLNEVIKRMQLEGVISPNTIRKNLIMTPIIPDDVIAKKEFALEKQGDSVEYFPDEYVLKLKVDTGSGLDVDTTQSIVNYLVSTYRDYFSQQYINREVLSDLLSFSDVMAYDYVDLSTVFRNQMQALLSFNQYSAKLAPEFRSKQTGMTFNDIIESLMVINDVDLTRWDSLLSSYKLSKKPDQLMLYYTYQINRSTDMLNVLKAQNAVNLQTLGGLEDSDNSLVSSLGQTDNQESSYFQTLVMSTVETGSEISSLEKDISYYSMEVADLVEGQQAESQRAELIEKSDNMVTQLYTDLSEWIKVSNITADEFYDQYLTSSFFALSPTAVTNTVRLPLNVAIGAVLGLMLSVFFVFFRSYWTNEHHGGNQ